MRESALELDPPGAYVAPTPALFFWALELRGPGGRTWRGEELSLLQRLDGVDASYLSADSAPPGYAVHRGAWITPLFLACVVAVSAGVAVIADALTRQYAAALTVLTGVDTTTLAHSGSSISIRPFALIFFALLAVFAAAPVRRRLRFLATTCCMYAAAAVLVDWALVLARPIGAPEPLSPLGGLVACVVVLLAGVYTIFTQYELPPGIRVETERKRAWSFAFFFVVALGLAALVGVLVDAYRDRLVAAVPVEPLTALSAIVAVLVLTVQLVLFLIGARRGRPKHAEGGPPSVAFLIPAYNEEGSIANTIEAIEAAARCYRGQCRLYLVDNGSSDRTAEEAAEALSRCATLRGEVLHCPTKGKAHALNFGLARTTEEIVVRVDADTLVCPSLLEKVAPYFTDETVGGVSGLPLPRGDSPRWLRPVWLMEVLHTIGFVRVGQNAIDGAVVLPGSMSVYRGDVVRRLGGFAVGHNGEDGDLAVRIGRLGYRLVTDRRVEFFTEVPSTLGHLIEQRVRWHRGQLCKTARNKSSIVLRQGLRGMLVLPWAALTACRRSLTVPILAGVTAASVVDPSIFSLRELTVIGATTVGLNLVVIALLLVVKRRPGLLPLIPAYVVFRVFKLYVAFAALLTLELRRQSAAAGEVRLRALRST